jgi:hypothetical protein
VPTPPRRFFRGIFCGSLRETDTQKVLRPSTKA